MRCLLPACLVTAAGALAACASDPPRELVNIAFTVSIDASAYRTFAFDLDACVDLDGATVDAALVRRAFVDAATGSLTELGYERVERASADFLVSYEFWIEEAGEADGPATRTRGSIVVRDGRSGDFLWRATRKAALVAARRRLDLDEGMRRFVDDMLRHVTEISRTAVRR